MDNSTLLSGLGSLIEFYSSRAEAHANFFLIAFFGLFAILAIVYSKSEVEVSEKKVWSVIFWTLFFMGLYFLLNFRYYASFADQIIQRIIILLEYKPEMVRIREIIIRGSIREGTIMLP